MEIAKLILIYMLICLLSFSSGRTTAYKDRYDALVRDGIAMGYLEVDTLNNNIVYVDEPCINKDTIVNH